MNGKFGRTYRLDVFTPTGEQITIEPPFSIKFNITRNTLASANKMQVTLYNLGAATRNRIFRDRYAVTEEWTVSLFAGYGTRLHEVFIGNLFEGYSYKQGTEWITSLDCFDGMNAIQNGEVSETIQKGTPFGQIVKRLIGDMPGLIEGVIGSPAQGEASRGIALSGNPMDSLADIVDGRYFIDKGKVNILADDEVLPGSVVVLDPSNLLSTPRRRETFIDVKTLFEPQVDVGARYLIESLEPVYNGIYKVVGFTHDVTISEAMNGTATTDLQLNYSDRIVVVNG